MAKRSDFRDEMGEGYYKPDKVFRSSPSSGKDKKISKKAQEYLAKASQWRMILDTQDLSESEKKNAQKKVKEYMRLAAREGAE